MTALAHSRHSARPERFDPESIRATIDAARASGLITDGAVRIEKNGFPATANGKLVSQWMEISPDLARLWLENNLRNRTVKDDVVKAYALDIKNGTWIPTHQGIAFNDRDELIDGQHRLHAIILADQTIRSMVTFGLPSEIEGHEMTPMDAVDRGRTRSVADQLKIQHGMKNGTIISAITAGIANICCSERTRRLSVGQTLDIYRAFEHSINFMIVHRPKQHGLRSAGVLAAFAFAIASESSIPDGSTPITLMLERLINGEDLDAQSAIHHLRKFLTSDEAKLLSRGTDRGLAELTLQAIWLELRGKPVASLLLAQDGINHFREAEATRVQKIRAIFELN